MRTGRRICSALVVSAVVLLGSSACGGSSTPEGISDAATEKVADTVPDWFPAAFPPPRDGVIVAIIEDPSTGSEDIEFGRSVTWRVDRSYGDVLKELDLVLANLGWQPTDRMATEGEADSQRTSVFIGNGTVEVIRVYTDANLKGTRVVVELPA